MKRIVHSLQVLIGILFLVESCEKFQATADSDQITSPLASIGTLSCGTPQVQNLIAGQTIIAGSISISNDDKNVYVTYTATGGWEIQKTQLYPGKCGLIPKNSGGNPVLGLFPNQTTHSAHQTAFTYTVSLTDLDSCYCVAAHANLVKVDGSGNIIQSETGWGQGNPFGGNTWAMIINYCTKKCITSCVINTGDYRTQTQGGWGAEPNGNNSGAYLHSNFSSAFPGGLVIGCSSGYTITFTSAQALTDFLPQGGTAAVLTQSYTNPTSSINVLAGQVATLALSVGFDANDPNFGAASTLLSSCVIASGTFQGFTVGQLLDEANKILGGCSSAYTPGQVNAAVDAINSNFDNGTTIGSFLICP